MISHYCANYSATDLKCKLSLTRNERKFRTQTTPRNQVSIEGQTRVRRHQHFSSSSDRELDQLGRDDVGGASTAHTIRASERTQLQLEPNYATLPVVPHKEVWCLCLSIADCYDHYLCQSSRMTLTLSRPLSCPFSPTLSLALFLSAPLSSLCLCFSQIAET